MAIVRPFKAVHYNPERVLLKQVIAPPYDVITPEYRETLLNRSQYNVVSIDLPVELPTGENRYSAAARSYESWFAENILQEESEPAIYLYEQEYDYNGKHYTRTGFVALLKLEPLSEGVVFPHEKTLSAPKQDRLELMLAAKANFSSVFGLYMDQSETLKTVFNRFRQGMPLESAYDDDSVKHTVWIIKDKDAIQQVASFMKDKAIYIADGHHRYETSLTYRDILRKKHGNDEFDINLYDHIMMTFVNCYDPGLLILPTHRLVDEPANFVEGKFWESVRSKGVVKELENIEQAELFLADNKTPGKLVLITKGKIGGLYIDPEILETQNQFYREVNTYILQREILEDILKMTETQILNKQGIHFYQSPEDVLKSIQINGGVGALLSAVNIDTLRKLAENKLVMPQKSTFFYPKLATGLLFNKLS
ncbi:MAG: DUF1015 domain-containing protein [Deferribacteraceae bacterium]|jgi:uncharacterized protein (DUF1015 family)|nr:DUF1015 domain-containing protein [Deferribacteraceae bacterium]